MDSFTSNSNIFDFILTTSLKWNVLLEQIAYTLCLFSNVRKVEEGSVICLLYVGS